MKRPLDISKKDTAKENEYAEFYEAMPMAQDAAYTYRDEADLNEPTSDELNAAEDQIRRFAIVVLVLVGLATVAVVVLFFQGFQTISGS